MNAIPEDASAMEIGQAIGRCLKLDRRPDGDPELRDLMVRLAATRCETPADALACLSLAQLVIGQTSLNIETGMPEDFQSPLTIAFHLTSRAIEALERSTGLTAASLFGAGPALN